MRDRRTVKNWWIQCVENGLNKPILHNDRRDVDHIPSKFCPILGTKFVTVKGSVIMNDSTFSVSHKHSFTPVPFSYLKHHWKTNFIRI